MRKLTRDECLSELRASKACREDTCDCDPQGGHLHVSPQAILFAYLQDPELEEAYQDVDYI
jgi:hypothetical protein